MADLARLHFGLTPPSSSSPPFIALPASSPADFSKPSSPPSAGLPPPSLSTSSSLPPFLPSSLPASAPSFGAPPPPSASFPDQPPTFFSSGGKAALPDFYTKDRGPPRKGEESAAFFPRLEVRGPSIVGDLRTNLDDIKSSLVGYYARLYAQPSTSIEARLDALSSSSRRSFESSHEWLQRRQREKRYESFIRATMDPLRDEPAFLHNSRASGRGRLGGGSAASRGSPAAVGFVEDEDFERDDLDDEEDFGFSRGRGREDAYPLSSSQRNSRGGEVYDMLRDLRVKCQTASTRLHTLADGLFPHLSNPNLREWEYNTIPKGRRRPNFESAELRRHVLGVYKNLHSQAEINQSRIDALQSKMKILQMQTHADMIKLQQDPRVAF